VFLQAESTAVTLPDRADVIVSDIRGVLPLHGRHIPVIADARARLLAPGGTLLPGADRLFAALVETPELHQDHLAPWGNGVQGLNFDAMGSLLRNTWSKARIEPSQLLTETVCVATLDYRTIEQPDLRLRQVFTASRPGAAHALAVWFETDLSGGIGFSNAPGQPKSIYGQAWFPLEGTRLAAGDCLEVRLDARLVGDDYVWRWGAGTAPDHSTLHGMPISRAALHKSADRHVPSLTLEGTMVLEALEAMRGGRSVGEVAHMLLTRHPGHFRDWNAALTFVGALSQRYSG
jgi:protein arginine N-methyltransferase 1